MNVKVERSKKLREAAMPEVKKLVKKFGRSTVSGCLQRLRDYEKKVEILKQKKQEIAQLEKEIK
jgi:50S ribosomal subunit-associated GTPase HflX